MFRRANIEDPLFGSHSAFIICPAVVIRIFFLQFTNENKKDEHRSLVQKIYISSEGFVFV
jgi:hypothetical protein